MHVIYLTLHSQLALLWNLDGLLHWTGLSLRRIDRLKLVAKHGSQVSDLAAQLLDLNFLLLILDVVQLAELVEEDVVLFFPLSQLVVLFVYRSL